MSVHYKFKSSLDFDTITFDGLHISVGDLKKAIIHQKRLGKSTDFDLQITNAQTKEEYNDDAILIPKNTSLIIARIPLAIQPKRPWDPQADKIQTSRTVVAETNNSGTLDLTQMSGTEEDKIQAMMIQSTMDYDPNNYQKVRGQGQTGEVPANYRCFKCHKPGHWIKNCPLGSNVEQIEVKRNTGIPRSFIERDFNEKSADFSTECTTAPETKQEIPEDLICIICKSLLTDAVMIPCCGSSFCDECIRTTLLESEDHQCPDCKEKGSSPGLLIPNRFLRNAVNAFRNETGYAKTRQKKVISESSKSSDTSKQASNIQHEEQSDQKGQKEATMSTELTNDGKPEEMETIKDTENNEEVEMTTDQGNHSSYDENDSDFEDNITVTVPPAYLQGHINTFRERNYNGRHSRPMQPTGIENSPKMNHSNRLNTPPERELNNCNAPITEDRENISGNLSDKQIIHQPTPHISVMSHMPHIQIRSTPSDIYSGVPTLNTYSQPQMQQPPLQSIMTSGRPYDVGIFNHIPQTSGFHPYMRGPFTGVRPGFHPIPQIRPRNMVVNDNLASVYQGFAAQVGCGIIDDPLEAFNRIMREKEKRKEGRRRRSRSIESIIRGRHSPPSHHNRSRLRNSEERRQIFLSRDRRGRSRDRRSSEKERWRHHSSSLSDRSSRSRSWSLTPRKRSKSPFKRRSRSRSQSSMSRSHSRSNSQGRFKGSTSSLRYNRSPLNVVSPRYRQKENRRPDKRDDYPRDEPRDRSPGQYYSRNRGGQTSASQYFRQERTSSHNQEDYFQHGSHSTGNSSDQYPYNRFSSREPVPTSHRKDSNHNRNRDVNHYDEGPPGPDEPPPPGFENSPKNQKSWGYNHYCNEYRDQGGTDNQKTYEHSRNSPDFKETSQSEQRDERRRCGRDHSRSKSRSSNIRIQGKSRKSHSRTPVRSDRNQDNSVKEKSSNKERHHTKDSQSYSSSKDKSEHEKKREREERGERRYNEQISKSKKDTDKQNHEKGMKHSSKDNKQKDKHKDDKKDNEKDKKQESSEEDKKDKKSREKRKKKKEKDERKRVRKEKKIKEKKSKEREKTRGSSKHVEKDSSSEKSQISQNASVEEHHQSGVRSTVEGSLVENQSKLINTSDSELKPYTLKRLEYKDENKVDSDYRDSLSQDGQLNEFAGRNENDQRRLNEARKFESNSNPRSYFDPDPEETDESNNESRENDNLPSLPELSKWEREDNNQGFRNDRITESLLGNKESDDKSSRVTNEVLRRAENAIFARAINAIRPIEIKKISVERQKLYADEPSLNISPTISNKSMSPKLEIQPFQTTVPSNTNSFGRSNEYKQEKSSFSSPIQPVKERIGNRIADSTPKMLARSSRSSTPISKLPSDDNQRGEKLPAQRSRSRDKKKSNEWDAKSSSDTKCSSHQRRLDSSKEIDRNEKASKLIDKNRDQQSRYKDWDTRKKDFHDHHNKRDKFKEELDKNRDISRSSDKSHDHSGRDRSEQRSKSIKSHESSREHGKNEMKNNDSDKYQKEGYRDSKDHRSDRKEHQQQSLSKKSDKKGTKDILNTDKNEELKYADDPLKSNEKTADKGEKYNTLITKTSTSGTTINTPLQVDDSYTYNIFNLENNNEQKNKSSANANQKPSLLLLSSSSSAEIMKMADKILNNPLKDQTPKKRSRSTTASITASVSSSECESASESGENRKRKRKKHKKEKKRNKRSSSNETMESNSIKHKRSKSKKKKSAKKKKKGKK